MPQSSFLVMQAISVIVTHRTDDMTKLPPRLPVDAPKPRKAPAPDRPKLRLGAAAEPFEAAAAGPSSDSSGAGQDVVMGEGLSEGGGAGVEEGLGEAQLGDEPAAFASPPKVHPSMAFLTMSHLELPVGG